MSVKDNDRLDDLAKTLDRVARELQTLRAENESREALTEGLTVRELADRVGLTEDVVLEFAQAAGEILGERPMSPQMARRAALLAAAEQVWEGELGPLLTSRQVRGLLGNVSRQRVDELLRARRLIGLRDSGGSIAIVGAPLRGERPGCGSVILERVPGTVSWLRGSVRPRAGRWEVGLGRTAAPAWERAGQSRHAGAAGRVIAFRQRRAGTPTSGRQIPQPSTSTARERRPGAPPTSGRGLCRADVASMRSVCDSERSSDGSARRYCLAAPVSRSKFNFSAVSGVRGTV